MPNNLTIKQSDLATAISTAMERGDDPEKVAARWYDRLPKTDLRQVMRALREITGAKWSDDFAAAVRYAREHGPAGLVG